MKNNRQTSTHLDKQHIEEIYYGLEECFSLTEKTTFNPGKNNSNHLLIITFNNNF